MPSFKKQLLMVYTPILKNALFCFVAVKIWNVLCILILQPRSHHHLRRRSRRTSLYGVPGGSSSATTANTGHRSNLEHVHDIELFILHLQLFFPANSDPQWSPMQATISAHATAKAPGWRKYCFCSPDQLLACGQICQVPVQHRHNWLCLPVPRPYDARV